MEKLPIDLVLYGVPLAPVVLAIAIVLQELGLSDYWADWIRAALLTLIAALVINQEALAALFPWLPAVVTQVVTLLGFLLTAKAVWPDLRAGWQRAVTGSAMNEVVARGGRSGRLW